MLTVCTHYADRQTKALSLPDNTTASSHVNLTHAHVIAIQNQWDLTQMHKDRFTICNNAAELKVPKEEI
jgi:hypothetical protein